MLVPFHRSGGLATASRAGLGRSGASRRITRLYSKFDALFRGARLYARAIERFATDLNLIPKLTSAGTAGLAIACIPPRHHTPGAQ